MKICKTLAYFGQGVSGGGQHSPLFLSDFSFNLSCYWARRLKPLRGVTGWLGTIFITWKNWALLRKNSCCIDICHIGFKCGNSMGREVGRLNCPFFHYSCKLACPCDQRVQLNCKGRNRFGYHQGRWYCGLVNMDKSSLESVIQQWSVVGNAGDWGNQLSFF